MPLVHRLLVTLRTLMEDEPEPPRVRRRRPNNGNRNRQTTALILTFRDLFRSGGLNIILDEMEVNSRPCKKSGSSNNASNNASQKSALCVTDQSSHIPDSRVILIKNQNASITTTIIPNHQDETFPLLQEEPVPLCTDLVHRPFPIYPSALFSRLAISRRKSPKKPKDLTVPLNPDDENKTVETLKKVLKWSPRKQNSATFAVSFPAEEEQTALAVVENAVNRVKEEQLRKKRRKFLWLKFC